MLLACKNASKRADPAPHARKIDIWDVLWHVQSIVHDAYQTRGAYTVELTVSNACSSALYATTNPTIQVGYGMYLPMVTDVASQGWSIP